MGCPDLLQGHELVVPFRGKLRSHRREGKQGMERGSQEEERGKGEGKLTWTSQLHDVHSNYMAQTRGNKHITSNCSGFTFSVSLCCKHSVVTLKWSR